MTDSAPPVPAATLDPDTLFSEAFLAKAGFTLLPPDGASFTRITWKRDEESRNQGLLWVPASTDCPYPVLTVLTDAFFDHEHVPPILSAAYQDHYMHLNIPRELADQVHDNWMAGRTLAPSIYAAQASEEKTMVGMLQSWPITAPVTPELLRYMIQTAFGQFRDVLIRAGFKADPDLHEPGQTGAGEREWLNSAQLAELAGSRWTWEESRFNEVRCNVMATYENGRKIEQGYYLRYVNVESQSVPALYLRAHTNGGVARGGLERVIQYNLETMELQAQGVSLPVTVDADGDLVVRQLVLCPECPDAAMVQHLIQTAELSLGTATLEFLE